MSVRLGMVVTAMSDPSGSGRESERGSLRSLLHLVEELPEQVVGVVRPGRRLGVVLHAEHRLVSWRSPSTVPSYRLRCVTSTSCGSDVGIDGEAVVLRRDLDLAGRRAP